MSDAKFNISIPWIAVLLTTMWVVALLVLSIILFPWWLLIIIYVVELIAAPWFLRYAFAILKWGD